MPLKSNFKTDLEKERKLSILLDEHYKNHLKHYDFERALDMHRQMQGIDLIFTHRTNGKQFLIDEKAQLDYVNEALPTFAFELCYHKKSELKKGWLYDSLKITDFYALITSIYNDVPEAFTSCKITFVNRKKLLVLLESKNITEATLNTQIQANTENHAKLKLEALDHHNEGYLYFSNYNKAEKPVNLILKLDFLIRTGVAKQFP